MSPLIIKLDEARTLAEAGGKGMNLGAMRRAGLPVPGGIVLSTAAYQAFVEAHQIQSDIERLLAVKNLSPRGFEEASKQIRSIFESHEIPAEIGDAVRGKMPEGPLAVRSSATAEDLEDASFAGQQASYLNVVGPEAVMAAIRRCWGSLWTARAMAYRHERGIAPESVSLAVVLQEMAPADAAGVMFTRHPITGAPDQVLLNATWGLGETLVSGRVNPNAYTADRKTGRVLQVKLGEKTVMSQSAENGTREVEIPIDRRHGATLGEPEVAALVGLGRQLEDLFACPQDVEWAVVAGRPVLLQSRPITTSADPIPGDDAWPPVDRGENFPFDFWTRQDMGERWPDPVTPLSWSLAEPMNQALMDFMVHGLRAPYAGKVRWSRRIQGRAYMNEGALLYAYTHGLGMPLSMMRSGLTHDGAKPPDGEKWRWGRVFAHLPFYLDAAYGWEKSVKDFEKRFAEYDGAVQAFVGKNLGDMDDGALAHEAYGVWQGRVLEGVRGHTRATSLSMSALTLLEDQMEKWMGDRSLAQDLTGGLTGVLAAGMVPELEAIAETLIQHGLAGIAREGDSKSALESIAGHPKSGPVMERYRAFLARHGHRCMAEAELLYPRWKEEPHRVLEQVRPILERSMSNDRRPVANPTGTREKAEARVMAALSPWKRAQFQYTLKRVHRFTRIRDNGQHYLIMLLLPQRMCLAELGRRWAGRRFLEQGDDIFFLVTEEIREAAASRPAPGLAGRAKARRAAWKYWSTQDAADGYDATRSPVAARVAEESDGVLRGVPASRGEVTGTARLIRSPEEAHRLRPGDILVTRATDPGWTPVFSIIGGAVIEIGGTLSHGAIVAREYGIPAVIGVPGAMTRIQDGEWITVSGTKGTVHGRFPGQGNNGG